MAQWGYTKNFKRGDVIEILREKAKRERTGENFSFTIRRRPVDLGQIQKHARRAHLHHIISSSRSNHTQSDSGNVVCRIHPTPLPQSLQFFQPLRASEKFLFDIEAFLQTAFESNQRGWNRDGLIVKTPTNYLDRPLSTLLFHMHLRNARTAADSKDYIEARNQCGCAFKLVDELIQSEYCGVIRILTHVIADMNLIGYPELAKALRNHIADCCRTYLSPNDPKFAIYVNLQELDMLLMTDVVERMMQLFYDVFKIYLGSEHTKSFYVMLNGAEHILQCNPWTTFDDQLPSITHMDARYGPTHFRTLDVLAVRSNVLNERSMFEELEVEAVQLIRRAEIANRSDLDDVDHIVGGWYFLGCSQQGLKKHGEAKESLLKALWAGKGLRNPETHPIYNMIRFMVFQRLQTLQDKDVVMAIEEV